MSDAGVDPDEQRLASFAGRAASLLAAAGLPRMPARVLMALMTSEDGALTAPELQETLGVSAGAVSGAVRYLQDLALVRRVAQTGSRRDLYEFPDDAWYTASMKADNFYAAMAELSLGAVAELGDPGSGRALRIAEMADYFRFMQLRVPQLLEEWEAERRDR